MADTSGFFVRELVGAGRFAIGMGEDVYQWFGYNPVSFNVIPARLLGIPYDDFLRIARDEYGGYIDGTQLGNPYIVFKKEAGAQLSKLVILLNKRWNEFKVRYPRERGF